jgi:uncharacterized membrane protein
VKLLRLIVARALLAMARVTERVRTDGAFRFWIVVALAALLVLAALPAFTRQALILQVIAFFGPAILLGAAVGFIAYNRVVWLAWTVVFVVATIVLHIAVSEYDTQAADVEQAAAPAPHTFPPPADVFHEYAPTTTAP